MSEPSYRINTEHKPDSTFDAVPWQARVTRLSDGVQIISRWGTTEADAIQSAQDSIRALSGKQPGGILFATEDGEILDAPVPTPESLKAS